MFKKLQVKFMWGSTLVLLLVISAVVGAVYWIATGTVMSQTHILMEVILEDDGEFSDQEEFSSRERTFLALSQESLYELRYFTALVSADETRITQSHIAIPEADAIELAEDVCRRRGDSGSMRLPGGRRMNYLKQAQEDGSVLLVLLDSTSRYGLIRIVMIYMAALWSTVLILYVIIMGRFSSKAVQPFIENDERQKRFITNASHELKTPLAVISANTEMTEVLGGKSKWTESTRRQIKRLQTLIENLVVLARLDEMKEAEMADFDLSAAIAETAEPFRGVAESAGKRFETAIAPGIHIRGDRRSLSQVASILLDNAVKYCDEGGAIAVRLEARGRGARLTVSNTYKDCKNVDTARFFERFYRQDESHNSEKSGFGIGLSMAREIVERMKGRLKVGCAGETISFTLEV